MSHEYVNTSVPKHLKGHEGYGPVVVTRNLPNGLEPLLEDLCYYEINPDRVVGADPSIDWCHRIVSCLGRSYTVLSRIGACGHDNTRRPIRIAHHVVLDPADRAEAGPGWMLRQFRGWITEVPAVEQRPTGPALPKGSIASSEPVHWKQAGLDPGWAGLAARYLVDAGGTSCRLVLPPLPAGSDVLGLVEDVLALMPPEKRWNVTFSTRGSPSNSGVRCQMVCLGDKAPNLASLLRQPGRSIEVKPGPASAPASRDADAAREGRMLAVGTAAKAASPPEPVVPAVVPPSKPAVPQGPSQAPETAAVIGLAKDEEEQDFDSRPAPSRPVPSWDASSDSSGPTRPFGRESSPPARYSSSSSWPSGGFVPKRSQMDRDFWIDMALYVVGGVSTLIAILIAIIRLS